MMRRTHCIMGFYSLLYEALYDTKLSFWIPEKEVKEIVLNDILKDIIISKRKKKKPSKMVTMNFNQQVPNHTQQSYWITTEIHWMPWAKYPKEEKNTKQHPPLHSSNQDN